MPSKFVFRLQPVLEQRERVERDHQLRVAELERERLEVEGRFRACQAGILAGREAMREQLGGAGGGGVRMDDVRMQASNALHLVAKLQRTAVELAGVHVRLGEARGNLLKAAAARKAVELLKAKRLDEFRADERKCEGAALDELTVMRHGRRGAWA